MMFSIFLKGKSVKMMIKDNQGWDSSFILTKLQSHSIPS